MMNRYSFFRLAIVAIGVSDCERVRQQFAKPDRAHGVPCGGRHCHHSGQQRQQFVRAESGQHACRPDDWLAQRGFHHAHGDTGR